MGWVTNIRPSRCQRLDREKNRNRPDYAFYFNHGLRYTIELERWLPRNVRQLENQAKQLVSGALGHKVKGTFIWTLPIEQFPNGEIKPKIAEEVISEIRFLAPKLTSYNSESLAVGKLTKTSGLGNRLVVQVVGIESVNIAKNPRLMRSLKVILKTMMEKAERKFYRYRGVRVLLLDVGQSGLDLDYHAKRSKYSEGIIRRWIRERIDTSTRIDYICIAQGMRVWYGADTRVLTGHKYVDQPYPNYEEVWHRPGLPNIRNSLSFFSNKPIRHI